VMVGQISQYNKDVPFPAPFSSEIHDIVTRQNITRQGFMLLAHGDRIPAAVKQISQWIQEGKIKSRETVEEGLVNTGKAFVSMMKGGNIGKQLVKVADFQ